MTSSRRVPPWAAYEPVNARGHNTIFDRFERSRPFDKGLHHHNFMGARISHLFEHKASDIVPGIEAMVGDHLMTSGRSAAYDDDPTYPYRDSEDYFEWIDLLTAIDRAESQFTMVELGAGYGRWIANAAAAIRRRHDKTPLAQTYIGLEANKDRFAMMVENCSDNGIPPTDLRLTRAACTTDGKPVFIHSHQDYGASVLVNPDAMAMLDRTGGDQLQIQAQDGRTLLVEKVPALRLEDILTGPVDFMDMDIQGTELDVTMAGIDAMDRFVKMVHVGTHSLMIEAKIAPIFHLHGWRPRRLFSCHSVNRTPYGEFHFVDGIQTWENPRFSHRPGSAS